VLHSRNFKRAVAADELPHEGRARALANLRQSAEQPACISPLIQTACSGSARVLRDCLKALQSERDSCIIAIHGVLGPVLMPP
jgi:hypothetical protein